MYKKCFIFLQQLYYILLTLGQPPKKAVTVIFFINFNNKATE